MTSILPSLARSRFMERLLFKGNAHLSPDYKYSPSNLVYAQRNAHIDKADPTPRFLTVTYTLNAQLESEKRCILRVSYCSASARIVKAVALHRLGAVDAIIN